MAITGAMKTIQCESPCNFMVKSHDEKELVEIVKTHAKKIHNMNMADKDVKAMIKAA